MYLRETPYQIIFPAFFHLVNLNGGSGTIAFVNGEHYQYSNSLKEYMVKSLNKLNINLLQIYIIGIIIKII